MASLQGRVSRKALAPAQALQELEAGAEIPHGARLGGGAGEHIQVHWWAGFLSATGDRSTRLNAAEEKAAVLVASLFFHSCWMANPVNQGMRLA